MGGPWERFGKQYVEPVVDHPAKKFSNPQDLSITAQAGAMAARDMSGGQAFAAGMGRGALDLAQGVKQLSLQNDVAGLEDKATNPMATYLNPDTGLRERVSPKKREEFKLELEAKRKELSDYSSEKSRELALFEAGQAERPVSMMGGRMVGGAMAAPVPAVGFGGALVRILGEGAIGATTAGLEFVPDGMDRASNMTFAAVLSGGFGTLGEIFKRMNLSEVVDAKTADEFKSKIRAYDEGEY